LYLAKGGYSLYQPHTPALQDELYLNNGNGSFTLAPGALPDVSGASKSCVRPGDYDNDGDLDLFVGSRVVPGRYPVTPVSYLLNNNGQGQFALVPASFSQAGMVTDAQWADLNQDGRQDLILCGEFMPIMVFNNTLTGFVNGTAAYFPVEEKGFWNTLTLRDLNQDGQLDIVAGNLGLNSPIQVSGKEPAELYYADFDTNGSVDPFFNFYIGGKSYPFVSRDELNEQIYPMRKRFTSYQAYADATMQDIFSPEELMKAEKLTVTENKSVYFINTNGRFLKKVFPLEAQFSVITRLLPGDFNRDGHQDLILFGNHSDNRLKLGSMDANYGCFLAGDGKGNFTYINQQQSGLSVIGDVKSATEIKIGKANYILLGAANEALQFYRQPPSP
jgi:enediyne biosynthesis protein E4